MLGGLLKRAGYLFYAVNPKDNVFETVEEIPNYILEVVPLFIAFVVFEFVFATVKLRKKGLRINDAFGSLTAGMLSEVANIWVKSIFAAGYIWVHGNYSLFSMTWDSTISFLFGLIAVDFVYYWLHRASHEVNIFWAAHQVHHSSEDYNLATALRQSVMQHLTYMLFYLPLALVVPPTIFFVHNQLNLLYQFWIHTEVVHKIGPLEYILNTPSHHRVHHGRNRYCIDVNYAGLLIIWDRMFGTFHAEEEEVVYGLVHPINTFDPIKIQLGHYAYVWKTFWSTPGLGGKLSVLFKGPGWAPGKPRLGDPQDIPDVHAPMEKYDPQIPLWMQLYTAFHFVLILIGFVQMSLTYDKDPFQMKAVCCAGVILTSLTFLASILDKMSYGPALELCRCLFLASVGGALDFFNTKADYEPATADAILLAFRICFAISGLIWTGFIFENSSLKNIIKKNQ